MGAGTLAARPRAVVPRLVWTLASLFPRGADNPAAFRVASVRITLRLRKNPAVAALQAPPSRAKRSYGAKKTHAKAPRPNFEVRCNLTCLYVMSRFSLSDPTLITLRASARTCQGEAGAFFCAQEKWPRPGFRCGCCLTRCYVRSKFPSGLLLPGSSLMPPVVGVKPPGGLSVQFLLTSPLTVFLRP